MEDIQEVAARAFEQLDADFGIDRDDRGDHADFFSDARLFGPWFDSSRSISVAVIDSEWQRRGVYGREGFPERDEHLRVVLQSTTPDTEDRTREDFVREGEDRLDRARRDLPVGMVGAPRRKAGRFALGRIQEVEGMGLLGAVQTLSDAVQVLAPGIEAGVGAALAINAAINPQPFVAPGGATVLPRVGGGLGVLGGQRFGTQGLQPLAVTQAGLPALIGGAALGGLAGEFFGEEVAPLVGQLGAGALQGLGGSAFFAPTMAGMRARHTIERDNPVTGKRSWWINRGRPTGWSGDRAACKRVRKERARANRVLGPR